MNWQVAYIVGGAMGLVLLALRVGTFESGLFKQIEESDVRARRPAHCSSPTARACCATCNCILIGIPIWYVIGVLVSLSQDVFVPELGIDTSSLDAEGLKQINGTAIRYAYIGLSIGDLLSGLLSQWQRSRRKVILIYLALNLLLTLYLPLRSARRQHCHLQLGLPVARSRHGLLGDLRHRGQRAVRHQHPQHGGHHGAQLRTRQHLAGEQRLPLPGLLGRQHLERAGDRGSCASALRFWAVLAHAGDLQPRHGFRGAMK